MNKTLRRMMKKKKPFNNKRPKIVTVNRPPSTPWMKWLLVLCLVLLVGFTIFYIVKITSSSFAAKYAEKFEEPKQFEMLLVHNPSCPACQAFHPVFTRMKEAMPGIKFSEIIYDSKSPDPSLASSNITAIPTIIMKDPQGVDIPGARNEGGLNEKELVDFINKYVPAQYTSQAVTPTVSGVSME